MSCMHFVIILLTDPRSLGGVNALKELMRYLRINFGEAMKDHRHNVVCRSQCSLGGRSVG